MRRTLVLIALAIAAALPVMGSALHAQQPALPQLTPGKQFGFVFQPVAEGAKIVLVAPGSPAALAGLKEGMIVTGLNGVPLGALDATRLYQMFAAAPDEVTLAITPLGWVKLRRAYNSPG
jgi:S1-C subfamily serine protease